MQLKHDQLIEGLSTTDALIVLVSQNECVASIFVFEYQHPQLLQNRIALSVDERAIVAKAIAIRPESAMPFWEALMLSCFDDQRDWERILNEAAFHQSHTSDVHRISRSEVLSGGLAELATGRQSGRNLSFSSLIECGVECHQHLLLLDFHCAETRTNDRLVTSVCKRLFPSSILLFSSGESYHAVGTVTVDDETLRAFLTRSLLYSPIVDSRYVAHQLLEGACALRLTSSAEKPVRPRLKVVIDQSTDE